MAGLSSFKGSTGPKYLYINGDATVRLQFLCEPEQFKFVVEHTAPGNWRNTAQCTFLDGCWACEQQSREFAQRVKVYMPVLVKGEPHIWSQSTGKGSGMQGALARIKEHGTVLDTVFDVTRSGNGKRTKYTAIPVDNGSPVLYTGQVSLEKVTKVVPYEQQANYYKK